MQGCDPDVPLVSQRHDYKCGKISQVKLSYCDQAILDSQPCKYINSEAIICK